jgi:hypothetical protein
LAVGTYLPRPYAAEPLKVSAYTGKFEEKLAKFIYPAFTKESGIAIELVSQSDGLAWFEKLEAAHTFINYCTDPAVQTEITRRLGTAPVVPRRLTTLSNEEYLTASKDNTPIVPRYVIYVKDCDWIIKTWAGLIGA